MYNVRARFFWVYVFLIAGFLISCSPKVTPPGANIIYGGVDMARYFYHYWEEGLAILFWHNFVGGESCTGAGSTEDPVYRLECHVESEDGQSFGWEVNTQDGMTADLWIDGQRYDLSQGNMFLISTGESGFQVEQLQRDFSKLESSNDAISALASNDPDVAGFIARYETVSDSSEAADGYGLTQLEDALRLASQSVEIGGPVGQSFFYVPGQLFVVGGEDVQVFEYPDSAAAQTVAAQISPDATTVGNSTMSWAITPRTYGRFGASYCCGTACYGALSP
jgi:hypothetical protein